MHVQRLVCIVGISTVMIIVFFACVIRNPKLPDTQSMAMPRSLKRRVSFLSISKGILRLDQR
ncbi:hypothetical protein P153DRAFT_131501 [Dothidotthia symphoricarpi CBS 119687]|uniref:Uncharacterized protein n=1 Tax=Dothidotthia symphoricarpi CBS 119687 TaxID=1392245 RepID=A0A6A5ZXC0_9PLEO|nr:uncharacterized protein P153DRAFT_131501 [Dothidotthia symphoricarpi CBS 119687]KAF2124412.1 hypothetical protein P153DRAFT_131501 [Dothidotthia symphoricarpi CBS 119687]